MTITFFRKFAAPVCCWTAFAWLAAAEVPPAAPPVPVEIGAAAVRAPETIRLDGVLDEAVWRSAAAGPMMFAQNFRRSPDVADFPELLAKADRPTGFVQAAWDDRYLYLAIRLLDGDVCSDAVEEQQHNYRMGDTAEIFLKPENAAWFWEFHVTPGGLRSVFFYPGRGRRVMPSTLPEKMPVPGFRVAVRIDGTFNNWHDTDRSWTIEMALPREELRVDGIALAPENPWRLLVGRYDFSWQNPALEHSSFPQLRRADFHLHREYAFLRWLGASGSVPAAPHDRK